MGGISLASFQEDVFQVFFLEVVEVFVDGVVNMGGFIGTRKKEWYEGAKLFCIPFEGYVTYGGMNGRDLNSAMRSKSSSILAVTP